MATSTQIKTNIDTDITNKTTASSISPNNVGVRMKNVVDYVDQEIANVGTSVTKVKKTSITSSQVLNIFTTPVEIIPAPGPGKLIIPSFIVIINKFNSSTYTDVGGAWKIVLGTSGLTVTTIVSYLGSATYDKETMQSLFYNAVTTVGTFINQPLKLTTTGNNPIGGDSGIDVYVTYEEITL